MGTSAPGSYVSHDILAIKPWRKRPAPQQQPLDRRRIRELTAGISDRERCILTVIALDRRALSVGELARLVRGAAAFHGLRTGRLITVIDDICIGLGLAGRVETRGINGHRIVRVNVVRRLRARPLLHVKRGPPTEPTLSGERC